MHRLIESQPFPNRTSLHPDMDENMKQGYTPVKKQRLSVDSPKDYFKSSENLPRTEYSWLM